eukprot:4740299-Amphidinium_carterae.1
MPEVAGVQQADRIETDKQPNAIYKTSQMNYKCLCCLLRKLCWCGSASGSNLLGGHCRSYGVRLADDDDDDDESLMMNR